MLLKEIIIREKKIGNFWTLIFKNWSKSMESPNFFPRRETTLSADFFPMFSWIGRAMLNSTP